MSDDFVIGQRLGDYEILGQLGAGGRTTPAELPSDEPFHRGECIEGPLRLDAGDPVDLIQHRVDRPSAAIEGGAVVTVAGWSTSGGTTSVDESLSYGGIFRESAGGTLPVAAGDRRLP